MNARRHGVGDVVRKPPDFLDKIVRFSLQIIDRVVSQVGRDLTELLRRPLVVVAGHALLCPTEQRFRFFGGLFVVHLSFRQLLLCP